MEGSAILGLLEQVRTAAGNLLGAPEAAAGADIRQAALAFAAVKGLSKQTWLALDAARDAVQRENAQTDSHHLSLENLQYERGCLAREVARCREFSTPELDLIPLTPLEELGGVKLADGTLVLVPGDAHATFKNRLAHELEERQRLERLLVERRKSLAELQEQNLQKRCFVEALPAQAAAVKAAAAGFAERLIGGAELATLSSRHLDGFTALPGALQVAHTRLAAAAQALAATSGESTLTTRVRAEDTAAASVAQAVLAGSGGPSAPEAAFVRLEVVRVSAAAQDTAQDAPLVAVSEEQFALYGALLEVRAGDADAARAGRTPSAGVITSSASAASVGGKRSRRAASESEGAAAAATGCSSSAAAGRMALPASAALKAHPSALAVHIRVAGSEAVELRPRGAAAAIRMTVPGQALLLRYLPLLELVTLGAPDVAAASVPMALGDVLSAGAAGGDVGLFAGSWAAAVAAATSNPEGAAVADAAAPPRKRARQEVDSGDGGAADESGALPAETFPLAGTQRPYAWVQLLAGISASMPPAPHAIGAVPGAGAGQTAQSSLPSAAFGVLQTLRLRLLAARSLEHCVAVLQSCLSSNAAASDVSAQLPVALAGAFVRAQLLAVRGTSAGGKSVSPALEQAGLRAASALLAAMSATSDITPSFSGAASVAAVQLLDARSPDAGAVIGEAFPSLQLQVRASPGQVRVLRVVFSVSAASAASADGAGSLPAFVALLLAIPSDYPVQPAATALRGNAALADALAFRSGDAEPGSERLLAALAAGLSVAGTLLCPSAECLLFSALYQVAAAQLVLGGGAAAAASLLGLDASDTAAVNAATTRAGADVTVQPLHQASQGWAPGHRLVVHALPAPTAGAPSPVSLRWE
jgi:hypothetical protein